MVIQPQRPPTALRERRAHPHDEGQSREGATDQADDEWLHMLVTNWGTAHGHRDVLGLKTLVDGTCFQYAPRELQFQLMVCAEAFNVCR